MNLQTLACLVLCTAVAVSIGCRQATTQQSNTDTKVDLTFEPSPPVVGDAKVTLSLASESGEPIKGAEVQLEGNMNHAGMKPSFADLAEVEPGRYTGTLEFTMSGDWFILVTATTKDGQRVERKIDVKGVQQP